jgi:hypothetical protein
LNSRSLHGRDTGYPAPPYRPRRAVCPHRVPQLYSLPRCKVKASHQHPPTPHFRDTRHRNRNEVDDALKLRPRVTPSLASTVEPLANTVDGPLIEAVQRTGISSHPIVIVVPLEADVETLEKLLPWQMPVSSDPLLEPSTGGVQALAGHPSLHLWLPLLWMRLSGWYFRTFLR